MTEKADLWLALPPVIDAFEALRVSYYIGGSVASSMTGVARATQDADVVADLRLAHGLLLTKALENDYYISRESVLAAIRARKHFNVIHLATAFKVDVFVSPDTRFGHQTMARRVAIEVPELERVLEFSSAEDIVLHKLRWYEMGNRVSDRQWYDLQGVLRLQNDRLDLAYLRRWASELGLEALLKQALSEAGLRDR